jgi:hypothetical protein
VIKALDLQRCSVRPPICARQAEVAILSNLAYEAWGLSLSIFHTKLSSTVPYPEAATRSREAYEKEAHEFPCWLDGILRITSKRKERSQSLPSEVAQLLAERQETVCVPICAD